MDRIDLPFYYELGTVVRPLTQLTEETRKGDAWVATIGVDARIRELLDTGLVVTKAPAEALLTAMKVLDDWPPEEFRTDSSWEQRNAIARVAQAARDLEVVALSELRTLPAFKTTKKGAYDSIILVEHADIHLLEGTRRKLDEAALRDVKESGRCLAFDSPTASGFHMMRAVEHVTRDYWIACCSPNDEEQKKRLTLGEYVQRLRASGDVHAKEVVELLDQIREKHRNLLLHANEDNFLEPDDAFTLFHIGMTVIMVMAEKLIDRKVAAAVATIAGFTFPRRSSVIRDESLTTPPDGSDGS